MGKNQKRIPNRLLTDAFREIINTRSRFLSIMILSALAVCFLAGLRVTEPDMKNSMDQYLDAQHLMDLRVTSTLGLTEEDVAVLGYQEGVSLAQGAYTIDATVKLSDKDSTVKVLSYTQQLNIPALLEGRMPQNNGECLVEPRMLQETGLRIGDSIELDTGTGNYENALVHSSFTVVGSADSPLYVGVERGSSSLGTGKASYFILLPTSAFSMDSYTDAYLLFEGTANLMTYSDTYTTLIEQYIERLEPLADVRAQLRGDSIREDAQNQIDQAQTQLDEARHELSEAEKALLQARSELDAGWDAYREGVNILDQELSGAQAQLSDTLKTLEDTRKQLDEGQKEYAAGLAEYEENLRSYYEGEQQYQDGLKQYQDGVRQLEEARQELEEGRKEYRAGLEQYNAGIAQAETSRQQLQQQETLLQGSLTAFRQQLTGLGYSYDSNEALLSALEEEDGAKIDAMLNRLRSEIYDKIKDTQESISDGQKQLSQDKNNYSLLSNEIPALEQEINQLELQVQHLEKQISALQEAIEKDPTHSDALKSELEQLKLEKKMLEERLNQSRQQLKQKQGQYDALQSSIPRLEEEIASQQKALSTLRSELSRLYTTANGQTVPVSTTLFLSSWNQLQQGWKQLELGQQELKDSQIQLEQARLQLEQGAAELAQGEAELAPVGQQLEQTKRQLEQAWEELENGRKLLEANKETLDQGEEAYADGLQQWRQGEDILHQQQNQGEAALSDTEKNLSDHENSYSAGLSAFLQQQASAQEQLEQAEKELEQAQRDLDALDESKWYLLDRDTNMGYVSYSMDADRMGNLASVFPLIFFLVAALVCLTTMTRMVEEQRTSIGCLKALGYSQGAIALKYVGYGFLSSAIGSLIGLGVGLTLLPLIICTAWKIIYAFGPIHYGIELGTSLTACLAASGTVTLAAFGACFSTLTTVPAQFMRPKTPPMGKRILLERITFLWSRLSFNYKITLRNLFRYQKRFWMTVSGIGGCAALIVTAFGLRDSIFAVMDKQYGEIYHYSSQLGLVENITSREWAEVEETLDGSPLVQGWTREHTGTITAQTSAYTADTTLHVVENMESLEPFVVLRHRTDSDPVTLTDDGVILSEKLAQLLEVNPGDTITLDGDERVSVRVADVTEHYIQHNIYMTDSYYQQIFGEAPEKNAVLISYTQQDTAELERELVSLDGVSSLTRSEDTKETFGTSLASVDYAVALIIVCAAALAFVVLYNLTNINITERLRELATLKVLGFYDGELSAYIYRENVILTVFGVALGMFLGKLLHQWLVLTVEIDLLMFGREAQWTSYLWAALLTAIFSLMVNLAAHRKLKGVDMVESLKAIE